MAGFDPLRLLENELRKLKVLQQDGIISADSYQARAAYMQEHGCVPEAGVGISIRERYPFAIEDVRPDGPAAKTGVIKKGDELTKVDGFSLNANLTGEQVRPACAFERPATASPPGDAYLIPLLSRRAPVSLLTTHVSYH